MKKSVLIFSLIDFIIFVVALAWVIFYINRWQFMDYQMFILPAAIAGIMALISGIITLKNKRWGSGLAGIIPILLASGFVWFVAANIWND